jgi:hypothetical protein
LETSNETNNKLGRIQTMTTTEFGTLDPETAEAVATAETLSKSGNAPKVIGKGIYLELINPQETDTTQILITPAGINDKGEATAMAVISRSVSEWSPRRQWRVNFVRTETKLSPEENTTNAVKEVMTWIERNLMYSTSNTLRNGKPIVFEVSNIDLTDVADWKAPAPALRRLQKARLELGFPAELYQPRPIPTPAIAE